MWPHSLLVRCHVRSVLMLELQLLLLHYNYTNKCFLKRDRSYCHRFVLLFVFWTVYMCSVLLLSFVYFEGQRRDGQIKSVASTCAAVQFIHTAWINITQAKLELYSVDYSDLWDPDFCLDLHQFLITHRLQSFEYACSERKIPALFLERVMKVLEGKWNHWIRPFYLDLHGKLMGSVLSWHSSSMWVWWKLVEKFLCNPADKPTNKYKINGHGQKHNLNGRGNEVTLVVTSSPKRVIKKTVHLTTKRIWCYIQRT